MDPPTAARSGNARGARVPTPGCELTQQRPLQQDLQDEQAMHLPHEALQHVSLKSSPFLVLLRDVRHHTKLTHPLATKPGWRPHRGGSQCAQSESIELEP
eukprot:CAMPEP_0197921974 /NCGR_PEP_ID=MMETSP1439-20131203/91575_1 /TAXON_ID=66791 /ORGANISM="Gonyaulax spinifera, Strain CCMP409" /LENGTH=99 /DNA_ID=CAMNT_0043544261 /DNA_START=544 /DNA_END=840 /DNA_ORIENTATION=+